MSWKMISPVLETRCGGARGASTKVYKGSRNRQGPYRESEGLIVCAGQRPDQVGSSPTGARMRGAISKSGGNASLAGERE